MSSSAFVSRQARLAGRGVWGVFLQQSPFLL